MASYGTQVASDYLGGLGGTNHYGIIYDRGTKTIGSDDFIFDNALNYIF